MCDVDVRRVKDAHEWRCGSLRNVRISVTAVSASSSQLANRSFLDVMYSERSLHKLAHVPHALDGVRVGFVIKVPPECTFFRDCRDFFEITYYFHYFQKNLQESNLGPPNVAQLQLY
jgi:hypothetical protein